METDKTVSVAIIGLGYAGLPLAIQFARSEVNVIGLDVDVSRVRRLSEGRSYLADIDSSCVADLLTKGWFTASTDFSHVRRVTAVIICVPTPLNKNREPDITHVIDAGTSIAKYLSAGQLVVLESTVYPGATEQDLRQVLEQGSGLTAGKDFYLAFSPERGDPGNPESHVSLIPKVIGGFTPACLERAMALYGKAIKTVVPVSSCRTAEATKLLENIFRSVNIALVNELKGVYEAMGIDIWEVIQAAKTKPFGYMPFYPGPGPGGHCTPIAPYYLAWKAREYGQRTRFIEMAVEINAQMPYRVVDRVVRVLNTRKKALHGSRVLIVGIAYKSNVEDVRGSPGCMLMDTLTESGVEVAYFDPYVPVMRRSQHPDSKEAKSVNWDRQTVSSFDLVLIATAHTHVNYAELGEWAQCIVDTRNAMARVSTGRNKTWKA